MSSIIAFYLACIILGIVFIKKRMIAYIVMTAGYLLAVADFLADSLVERHIHYFLLSRIDMTMLEMAPSIIPQYFYGGIIVTVLVLVGHYHLLKQRKRRQLSKRTKCALGAVACCCLLCSATTRAYVAMANDAVMMDAYRSLSAEEIQSELNTHGDYPMLQDVQAEPKQNLVIIYLESLENNFMDEARFPYETVCLNRLKKEGWYAYDNYTCAYGGDWTVGALYATQTGLPSFFELKSRSNRIFEVESETKAISYTAVLNKAGYQNVFLSNSDLAFAGTGNIMTMLGYRVKQVGSFAQGAERSDWGVYDAQLFTEAKEEYRRLSESGRPFQITLLTVDTHFPQGHPDDSMRSLVDARVPSDTHEYTVATIDYLIGDFVHFIESQPNGKDTVIVLMSDHLMMGNKDYTPIVDKLDDTPRRNLLLVNRPIPQIEREEEIGYWDMPSIILSLAQVEHNMKFPADLINEMSESYIKEKEMIFMMFNLRLME